MILYSKTGFKRSIERFLVYKIKSDSNLISRIQLKHYALKVKNSLHTTRIFNLWWLLIALAKPINSESKIYLQKLQMTFLLLFTLRLVLALIPYSYKDVTYISTSKTSYLLFRNVYYIFHKWKYSLSSLNAIRLSYDKHYFKQKNYLLRDIFYYKNFYQRTLIMTLN